VTKWSPKSDIWGVGAVLHCILAGCVPLPDQPEELEDRTSLLETKLWPELMDCSKLLLRIVSECLDPLEDGRYRPTALQLLAVAIKSDTSPEGLQRSESFWQVMLTEAKAEDASAVLKHFVTNHLPLLAKEKTIFSPKEITLIMAMVFKHSSHLLFTAHNQLCQTFLDDPSGGTAFHALAHLEFDDEGSIDIRLEHLKWPFAREMLSMALRKNKSGLFPSNLAAWAGKIPLCKRLTEIEYIPGSPN
jgi:serine/threonine protein kinase